MSCQGRGTAADGIDFPLGDAGSGSSIGFMQVMPEDFTREELQALLSRVRVLAQYGVFDDTKREFLECMAEDLDMLDALAAREEADLAELEETIAEHSAPSRVTITREPCCPYHPRFYGHGVGD